MEEFIPTFEEKKDVNPLIIKIDELEEQIKENKVFSKKYEKLKEEIKKQMKNIGEKNEASQVKWTTPKGIQITLSIGKKPVFEKRESKEFNMVKFMEEQPQMYEQYLEIKQRDIAITNGSSDTLRITLPKEEEHE